MLGHAAIALRNVGKRKKRAALTMLGVFIGIAAVVALVSLGEGLQKTINDQFGKVGADKIMIQAKEVGFGGQFAPGQLKRHELDIIENAHGVSEVAGALFRSAQVEFNDVQRTLYAVSVPETAREVALITAFSTWEAAVGRLLTHKDRGKAVIGYNLAHNAPFRKNLAVGDKVKISGRVVEVVGVLKRIGDPGADGGVILPEADLREILAEPEAFSYIVAQSAKGSDPEQVAGAIKRALRKDRHQKEGKEDFIVQSSTELIESFNAVLNIIQAVFIGIAAISLLVGGIGITNTMYTAVLERTREIGVMKAIGARNSDVLWIFLWESGMLGTAGGAIGVLIGMGISKLVELGANAAFGPGTIYATFPWYLIVGALAFSFVVGTVSGALPARRASRLKPVDALRYE
jgi:putative ABC transport system permease protein